MHIKDTKSRPKAIKNVTVTLWNEPDQEFTIQQLMVEMGFFVLLHVNNLTRFTAISQHANAVLSKSGDLVEVDSAVLCKLGKEDDEVHTVQNQH